MEIDRIAAEAQFGRLLLPLARRWRAAADRAMAGFGLSNSTAWVLLHVGRLGETVKQNELAAAIDITEASLVRLIDQLEQTGFAERQVDAADRRARHVVLTGEGRALVDRLEHALRAIRSELLTGIDDADLVAANRVLSAVDERERG